MSTIYFSDFKEIIKKELESANKSVQIAVAWINFNMYYDIFNNLLENNIKLEVIVNSDVINDRYKAIIKKLVENGMEYKSLKMPTRFQYMHHKFCLIDNKKVLLGSYNWTENALTRNFEDLLIIKDKIVAKQLINEFKILKKINSNKIKKMQQMYRCNKCKDYEKNICVIDSDEDHTIVEIYSICSCKTIKQQEYYFNLYEYNKLLSIGDEYDFYLLNSNEINDIDKRLLEVESI